MGNLRPVQQVRFFIGLLSAREEWLDAAVAGCEDVYGPVEKRSELMSFEYTDYYASEMGAILHRQFVTFRKLVDPDCLPDAKLKTNEMEAQLTELLASDVERPVNIDPGYLSPSGVFLATTKNFIHRIYLGKGIYGEITLQFVDGSYAGGRWSYPDYKAAASIKFFNEARARYMQQLKKEGVH